MKVIRQYSNNTPLYTIGTDNVVREYAGNAPLYTISGDTIRKYVGNAPVYTISGDTIREYVGNAPVYTISGDTIRKYVGNTPVYIISADGGSSDSGSGGKDSNHSGGASSDNGYQPSYNQTTEQSELKAWKKEYDAIRDTRNLADYIKLEKIYGPGFTLPEIRAKEEYDKYLNVLRGYFGDQKFSEEEVLAKLEDYEKVPLTPGRILGFLFLLFGIAMIIRF